MSMKTWFSVNDMTYFSFAHIITAESIIHVINLPWMTKDLNKLIWNKNGFQGYLINININRNAHFSELGL